MSPNILITAQEIFKPQYTWCYLDCNAYESKWRHYTSCLLSTCSIKVPFPSRPRPWSHGPAMTNSWKLGHLGFISRGRIVVIPLIIDLYINIPWIQHGLVQMSWMSKCLQSMLPIFHVKCIWSDSSAGQKNLKSALMICIDPQTWVPEHLIMKANTLWLYEMSMHIFNRSN